MTDKKNEASTAKLYRVKNWSTNFEGAKSKTYNNKTSCSMPCKHGLGYKRLVRSKDGAAVFGAWCALVQVLSRHNKERRGYCTDSGLPDGIPYTPDDLEMLTDIPAEYFAKMFEICSSQGVGWIEVMKSTDTIGDQQETIVPLNSDLDSNLNSDLDSNSNGNARIDYSDFLSRFNSASGKKCRVLDEKTKRQLRARLKDGFMVDEIITATKNCANDDYHKQNPKYLTPEFITRADKLQMYLTADQNQKTQQPAKSNGCSSVKKKLL